MKEFLTPTYEPANEDSQDSEPCKEVIAARIFGIIHAKHSGMKTLRGAGKKMFPIVPNDYSLRNVVPYIYMRAKSRMSERPR
jgi:hypothetical protein